MNILIIGSGSYVLEDPYGPGVVLRSILQWGKDSGLPLKIGMTYHTVEGLPAKKAIVSDIMRTMAVKESDATVSFLPSHDVERYFSDEKPEAAFIAVPDSEHASYCRLALKHFCPLWIVKPFMGNLMEAYEICQLASVNSVPIWVDYHKRFDTSNATLKLKAHHGDLGRMLVYSVDYHQPRTLPLEVFSWTKAVDVFTYIGCHYVDQIFYLLPHAKPVAVSAKGVKGKIYAATGQYDGVLATLQFDVEGEELFVPMNIGWFNPVGSPTKSLQVLKVQFEQGLIDLDQTRRGVHIWDDRGVVEVNPYFFAESLKLDGACCYNGYGYESVRSFLDLVSKGVAWPHSDVIPNMETAYKTEEVLYGVQESLKTATVFDFTNLPAL